MNKIYFDNKDVFDDFGVFLISHDGLFDPLELKKPLSHSWEDEHGEDVYLDEVYFEQRKFSIEIGIKASSASSFKENLHDFYAWLQSAGLCQLRIDNVDKVFMCYLNKNKPFKRYGMWNSVLNVGSISLSFVEPEPVNRQYYTNQTTPAQVSVTIASTPSDTLYRIHWGDGTYVDVVAGDTPVTHDYVSGQYYIVITGKKEHITTLTVTNSTEVTW